MKDLRIFFFYYVIVVNLFRIHFESMCMKCSRRTCLLSHKVFLKVTTEIIIRTNKF